MIPRPPVSTPTNTPFPYPTLFRSYVEQRIQHRERRSHRPDARRGEEHRDRPEQSESEPDKVEPPECRAQCGRDGSSGRGHECFPFVGTNRSQLFVASRGGRSEEHTSELQSLMRISYAVFCLK